jgi:hypothetical protein
MIVAPDDQKLAINEYMELVKALALIGLDRGREYNTQNGKDLKLCS